MKSARWLPPVLAGLALLVWLAVVIAPTRLEGPTVDEPAHLARGAAFWRTGQFDLYIGHPYFINALTALPVVLDSRVNVPVDHYAWLVRDWVMFHDVMFWKSGNEAMRLLVVARWMVVLLSVVLGAVLYRLGADLGGPGVGLAALGLAMLDPTLRAHSRLVTTDLGVTLFWALSLWLWWRWWRRPTWARAVGLGLALAGALASKFTANIFMPPLILITLWLLRTHPHAWQAGRTGVLALAVAGLGVWALYGFEARPVLGIPFPVPLASYWEEFHWSVSSLENAPAYLLGQVSRTGFWEFFFVALAVKMPGPILGLSVLAVMVGWRGWRSSMWLWGPMLFYVVVAVVMRINIGYRHLMPLWPAFYWAGAWGLMWLWRNTSWRWARPAVLVLAVWLGVSNARIYPHDLTFFNELGEALGGPRVLLDSNFDWGQDLLMLADYVRRHDPEPLYVSYFGAAQLYRFGIFTRLLPPLPAPNWNPILPSPGWYAISATHLYGAAALDNPDVFDYFKQQRPVAVLGRTIYLYEVKPHLPGTVVACVAPAPWLGDDEAQRLFRGTLTRFLPTDCQQGLPLPNGPTWYYLRGERQTRLVADTLQALGAERVFHEPHRPPAEARTLYWLDNPAAHMALWPGVTQPAQPFEGCAEWLGYHYTAPLQAGPVPVETLWRFPATLPSPVGLSLQLAAPDGFTLSGSDGLAVPFERLAPGDGLIQRHAMTIPPDLAPGWQWRVAAYQLPAGQPIAPCRLPNGAATTLFAP